MYTSQIRTLGIGLVVGAVISVSGVMLFREHISSIRALLSSEKNRGSASNITASPSPSSDTELFHEHFDLLVQLNNKQLDFSQEEYQSTPYEYHDPDIHFHDGNGGVVHLHRPLVTLAEAVAPVKMVLTDTCFIDDATNTYCDNETHELRVYVNGERIVAGPAYLPQDLDRVLIWYGEKQAAEESIAALFEKVTDQSCIYSLSCPERGTPPAESCIADPNVPCVVDQQ